MGHQASYVLIEDQQTHIFFSRFGAMTIAKTLLTGPAATIAFTKELTPYDVLLDDVWGEGGVLIDADVHVLLCWTDHKLDGERTQHIYLRVLRQVWQGWTVYWAENEMADLDFVVTHGTEAFATKHTDDEEKMLVEDPQADAAAIEQLQAQLFADDGLNPAQLFAALQQTSGDVHVGIGFFDPIQPPAPTEDDDADLRQLFTKDS
jgi:hypothetical protein